MSVTVVSGVTGVGLSSICREARQRLPEEYTLINFGDSMLEQAATHGITTNRDELSGLSPRQIRRLQRRGGEYVSDQATEGPVLLATHLSVETSEGYIDGLPDDVLSEIAPERFVLVEADPERIIERRERSDRDLEIGSQRSIEFEQHLNRTAAFEYARSENVPLQLVENDQADDIGRAARELADLLENS